MSVVKSIGAAIACVVLAAGTAGAQSRPLATQDPEAISAGQIAVSAGLEYQRGIFYPASGLKGNLTKMGTFEIDFGVSSMAQIELSGGLRDRLAITDRLGGPLKQMLTGTGETTSDFEDAIIGAKIRFATETAGRPAMAVRFATRLPNAGNESGLGLDTTDFTFSLLAGKTVRSLRVVGNFGFGILGDPTRGDRQNDVLTYGISAARAIVQGTEFVAELNGRANTRSGDAPVGTESRSMMRIGTRLTRSTVRIDAALLVGVTKSDPTWGFSTGLTWVFNAFKVQ